MQVERMLWVGRPAGVESTSEQPSALGLEHEGELVEKVGVEWMLWVGRPEG